MRRRFSRLPALLMAALILGIAGGTVRAQSINATGVVVAGAAAISAGSGTTTVMATTPRVVINWSPDDTGIGGDAINFQSAGTSVLLVNHAAAPLTVLNRIVPKDLARTIGFSEAGIAQLVDLATGAARRGGTLYFYSPDGILVSAAGASDVGNLVRSASDLTFDARTAAGFNAGPRAANAAQIVPNPGSSRMVEVDGSAVIVAADASTITIRPDGLFDIQIDQPDSPTGDTPANTAPQRAYIVAMPRNDAITMAIAGGQIAGRTPLGFDVAGAAAFDGNAVVLSAVASAQAASGSLRLTAPPQAGAAGWLFVPGSTDPAGAPAGADFVGVPGVGSAVDFSHALLVESRDDRTEDGGISTQIAPDDARGQSSGGVSAASTPSNGAANAATAEAPDRESAKSAKAGPKRRKSQRGE